ncbi:unnamed protein product [marine sediment metagenome]|uniref:Uncharacterized protein n=1 Tax=marine sediment metagenome TaxID=412755 RepID=X1W2K4_9ZZZZ
MDLQEVVWPEGELAVEVFREPNSRLFIQAPLPHFNNTLPILITVPGQGTARERAAPLAPPGTIAIVLDPDRGTPKD